MSEPRHDLPWRWNGNEIVNAAGEAVAGIVPREPDETGEFIVEAVNARADHVSRLQAAEEENKRFVNAIVLAVDRLDGYAPSLDPNIANDLNQALTPALGVPEPKESPKIFGESGSELRQHALERLGSVLGSIQTGPRIRTSNGYCIGGLPEDDALWLWRVAHFFLHDGKHDVQFTYDGYVNRKANIVGLFPTKEEIKSFDEKDSKVISPKLTEEPPVKGPKPVPPENILFKEGTVLKNPNKPRKSVLHRLGIGR